MRSIQADDRRRKLFPVLSLWESLGLLLLGFISFINIGHAWEGTQLGTLSLGAVCLTQSVKGSGIRPSRAHFTGLFLLCLISPAVFVKGELAQHTLTAHLVDTCGFGIFLHIAWMTFKIYLHDARKANMSVYGKPLSNQAEPG